MQLGSVVKMYAASRKKSASVEQDHRAVKYVIKLMRGFKFFT